MRNFMKILLTISVIVLIGFGLYQLFGQQSGLDLLADHPASLIEEGDLARQKGDLNLAMQKYNQAIGSGEDLIAAYTHRARLYASLRQYQEAIDDYTTILEIDPSPEIQAARCNTYRSMILLDKALADCQAAFAVDPESVDIAAAMAMVYVESKKLGEAVLALEKALAAHPDSDRLFYVKSQIILLEGDVPGAIESLSRSIELSPKNVQYYWERGFLYYMNAQLDESKADMHKVIDLGDPITQGDALFQAGNLLRMMGETP